MTARLLLLTILLTFSHISFSSSLQPPNPTQQPLLTNYASTTDPHKHPSLQLPIPVITPRLLQDNPFSPTGEFTTVTPGIKPNDDALTIGIIDQITQQNGSSTNNTQSNIPSTSGTNLPFLNISIGGQANSTGNNWQSLLGSMNWIPRNVDSLSFDPLWIAATNFLAQQNVSYYFPNQIITASTQKAVTGTGLNLTFRSVKGLTRIILLVYSNYSTTLLTQQVLNTQSVPVNTSSMLFNVTLSLLQSLFYDFTAAPLSLLNGTSTNYSGFTIFDLRMQSKVGIYGFVARSFLDPNGSITSTVLSCNPITVNVTTQTVPVLASINIVKVDANFQFLNETISTFVRTNLNLNNFSIDYNSVIVWSNRAGSAILYYLNLTISPTSYAGAASRYLAGINYNLTFRQQTITYWRALDSGIPPQNGNDNGYQEVSYLQILSNSTFINVDVSARGNYPSVVVGPLVKIETRKQLNGTGFRLTYFGMRGDNVQAAYSP